MRVKTFQNLSREKPKFFTSKLQVRKVRLKRTKFGKRYPRPPQECLGLAEGGRDRNNARSREERVSKFGIFKENVRKATENLDQNKLIQITLFSFLIFFSPGHW